MVQFSLSMNKESIKNALERAYQEFTTYVMDLTPDEFEFAPDGKWSAGQQLEHLIKSVKPVNKGLSIPKFIIKQKFGLANRPSRSYDQLVERYKEKLELGGVASKPYIPGIVKTSQREKLVQVLLAEVKKMETKLDKWSEEKLDQYIFPHPLLGKVTVREMLYFTTHHAGHHKNLIKIYLKGV